MENPKVNGKRFCSFVGQTLHKTERLANRETVQATFFFPIEMTKTRWSFLGKRERGLLRIVKKIKSDQFRPKLNMRNKINSNGNRSKRKKKSREIYPERIGYKVLGLKHYSNKWLSVLELGIHADKVECRIFVFLNEFPEPKITFSDTVQNHQKKTDWYKGIKIVNKFCPKVQPLTK